MANGTSSNGSSDLSGLPTWLRSVITILIQHGVAVAIAVFLVWWISTKVVTNQEHILSEIQDHRRDAALTRQTMTDFAVGQRETQRTLVLLQLQTCLNTATDNTQRQECARAAR